MPEAWALEGGAGAPALSWAHSGHLANAVPTLRKMSPTPPLRNCPLPPGTCSVQGRGPGVDRRQLHRPALEASLPMAMPSTLTSSPGMVAGCVPGHSPPVVSSQGLSPTEGSQGQFQYLSCLLWDVCM